MESVRVVGSRRGVESVRVVGVVGRDEKNESSTVPTEAGATLP